MASVNLRERKGKTGVTYYLDIHHNGRRYKEYLSAKIKKAKKDGLKAEDIKNYVKAIRATREHEIISGTYDIQNIQKQKANFQDYFKSWIEKYNKKDKRKAKSTFVKYKELFGDKIIPVKSVDKKHCKDFLDFLKNHDQIKSDETVRSYWGIFKKLLYSAVDQKLFKESPAQGIRLKSTQSVRLSKQVLTTDEIQILANTHCGNEEIKRAALFCLNTGFGLAELRQLKWKHIQNNKISHFSRAKTKEPLTIDLNSNSSLLLGTRGKANELIFKDLPSNNGCNKTLRYWVKRAGIDKHITWYCFRHSFACNLLINGANPKTVANLLGHTTLAHIDKYLKHVDELNKTAVNSLPTINLGNLSKVI